jgi:hypothetical protein
MIEKPAVPAPTWSTIPLRRAPPGLRSLAPAQPAVERQAAASRQGPADAAGKNGMTSRTMTTTVVGRASSMRRLRRRASAAHRPYCRTNGCASYLDVDQATGIARCDICGYTRRVRPAIH